MCTGPHAFIPAANTARVQMVYSQYGQELMNVFDFQGDAPLIPSDLAGLVDEVNTAWAANIKPLQNSTISLVYIKATALDAEPAYEVTLPVGVAGSGGGAGLPSGTTFAVAFKSGASGRSTNGRMYWIGLAEPNVSGNDLTTGSRDAIVGGITAFFDAIDTATGLTHVIVSYCHDGAWRGAAVNTPVLNYIATDTHVDSQRRRLTGRGI